LFEEIIVIIFFILILITFKWVFALVTSYKILVANLIFAVAIVSLTFISTAVLTSPFLVIRSIRMLMVHIRPSAYLLIFFINDLPDLVHASGTELVSRWIR
jgi:hypothetical protein